MTRETWDQQIRIGGVALKLHELEEYFLGEYDGNLKRAFAIEIIQKTDITPVPATSSS